MSGVIFIIVAIFLVPTLIWGKPELKRFIWTGLAAIAFVIATVLILATVF